MYANASKSQSFKEYGNKITNLTRHLMPDFCAQHFQIISATDTFYSTKTVLRFTTTITLTDVIAASRKPAFTPASLSV